MREQETLHHPVMLQEVLEILNPKAGEIFVDGTFGAGGYSRGLLKAAPCQVYALDRDPSVRAQAHGMAQEFGERFQFLLGPWSAMQALLATQQVTQVDGMVFDVGVSSPQLDQAHRGFSFRRTGPLDMRMSCEGLTAAEVVNTYSEQDLSDIFWTYGEERYARRIARAIVRVRCEKRFETTTALADLIRETLPFSREKQDPATRTFQALRIYVNQELEELDHALESAQNLLKPQGRLVVVTFHSLEDRRVKVFLKERAVLKTKKRSWGVQASDSGGGGEQTQQGGPPSMPSHFPGSLQRMHPPCFRLLTKKPLVPGTEEIAMNPRCRSAKLRAAVKECTKENPGGDL